MYIKSFIHKILCVIFQYINFKMSLHKGRLHRILLQKHKSKFPGPPCNYKVQRCRQEIYKYLYKGKIFVIMYGIKLILEEKKVT